MITMTAIVTITILQHQSHAMKITIPALFLMATKKWKSDTFSTQTGFYRDKFRLSKEKGLWGRGRSFQNLFLHLLGSATSSTLVRIDQVAAFNLATCWQHLLFAWAPPGLSILRFDWVIPLQKAKLANRKSHSTNTRETLLQIQRGANT